MAFIEFDKNPDTVILIKQAGLREQPLRDVYLTKLQGCRCVALSLDYGDKAKPNKATILAQLEEYDPWLKANGIKNIIVADGEYFKHMAKVKKTTGCAGYIYDYNGMKTIMVHQPGSLFYNPALEADIDLSINALNALNAGNYVELGADIIHTEIYPESLDAIAIMLQELHKHPKLTCDIEAFSLKHHDCGIGTITFCWNKHEGTAFNVDYVPLAEPEPILNSAGHKTKNFFYGKEVKNVHVRRLLKQFFEEYKGQIIYHNISYDGYALVYQLWMDGLLDTEGLLNGLDIITRDFECTKLISYLATNSCAGNKLGLKHQAHEYTGNYAEDEINDIRKIEPKALLRYNLIDGLATWYVYEKNHPIMVQDEQLEIYETLLKPCVSDIIQMQLTGMCLDMDKVMEAKAFMSTFMAELMGILNDAPEVQALVQSMREEHVATRNASLKTKVISMDDEETQAVVFNPNSNLMVQALLYDVMGLPVLDRTATKQPATGAKTIEKLSELTTDEHYKTILTALYDYSKVAKILSSFIPAFEAAPMDENGNYWLFGSFNIGGTVSGRLSSNNPNMQNLD